MRVAALREDVHRNELLAGHNLNLDRSPRLQPLSLPIVAVFENPRTGYPVHTADGYSGVTGHRIILQILTRGNSITRPIRLGELMRDIL